MDSWRHWRKNGISYLIFILFLRDELFSAYYVCGNTFIAYAAKKTESETETGTEGEKQRSREQSAEGSRENSARPFHVTFERAALIYCW